MSALNPEVPLVLFAILDLPGLAESARMAGISAVVSRAQAWDLVRTIESVVTGL
jgi:hypothetical protein